MATVHVDADRVTALERDGEITFPLGMGSPLEIGKEVNVTNNKSAKTVIGYVKDCRKGASGLFDVTLTKGK